MGVSENRLPHGTPDSNGFFVIFPMKNCYFCLSPITSKNPPPPPSRGPQPNAAPSNLRPTYPMIIFSMLGKNTTQTGILAPEIEWEKKNEHLRCRQQTRALN